MFQDRGPRSLREELGQLGTTLPGHRFKIMQTHGDAGTRALLERLTSSIVS